MFWLKSDLGLRVIVCGLNPLIVSFPGRGTLLISQADEHRAQVYP